MKTSRKDFLRLVGGGSILAGAATVGSGMVGGSGPVISHKTADLPKESGVIPVPAKVVNPFEGIPERFETCEERIYDSVRFLPGQLIPQRWYLFTTPYGQRCPFSGQYKENNFTSMDMCGMLAAPNMFWIRKINIIVGAADLMEYTHSSADREALFNYGWNLWLGQKRYERGSLRWDSERVREFPMSAGLWIGMQRHFNMSFESVGSHQLSASGNGASLYVEFEGLSVRGVS